MKGSKAKKTRCLIRGARCAVEIIENRGLKCALVGSIAAFLHGSKTVPEDVSLVILQTEGEHKDASISDLLEKEDPTHFRMTPNRSGQQNNLRYYDSSDSPSSGFCRIRLTVINDPTHVYQHGILYLRSLPVVPFLPILIDHLQNYPDQADPRTCSPWPSSSQYRFIQNLLEASKGKTLLATPLSVFNHEARLTLERISRLLPQFSNLLLPVIHILPPTDFTSDSESSVTSLAEDSKESLSLNDSNVDMESDQDGSTTDPRMRAVYRIAKKVVKILRGLNVECALFGSAACSLYGNIRSPNDVDILVFPPSRMSREQVKQAIENSSRKGFHLERSTNPGAAYKVLYYRFGGMKRPRGFFPGNKCKIDILIPGILHLPTIPRSQIIKLGGLPVVPFSLLVLQKLQAWDDHLQLRWKDPKKYAKAAIDARDLQNLLSLDKYVAPLKVLRPWDDPVLFSQDFQDLSKRRVRDFCDHFPEFQNDFVSLGLLTTIV